MFKRQEYYKCRNEKCINKKNGYMISYLNFTKSCSGYILISLNLFLGFSNYCLWSSIVSQRAVSDCSGNVKLVSNIQSALKYTPSAFNHSAKSPQQPSSLKSLSNNSPLGTIDKFFCFFCNLFCLNHQLFLFLLPNWGQILVCVFEFLNTSLLGIEQWYVSS